MTTARPHGKRLSHRMAAKPARTMRKNEELARLVPDSVPALIWVSDLDGRCAYLSQSWLAFTGRSLADELGDGWFQDVHVDDRLNRRETYARASDQHAPFTVEYRLRRYDGEYRWVLDSGTPQFGRDGSFAGYCGSCVDVTELMHAAAEATSLRERVRLAMQFGKSVGWEWDIKTGQAACSGDLQTIFGVAHNTFVGTIEDFRQSMHPDDRESTWQEIETARQRGAAYEGEFRIRSQDGTVRWVAAKGRFFPSPEGEPERMLGLAMDITERKETEESLRRKELELTEAQRLAGVGSWHWDQSRTDVTWSRELYRIAGVEPGSTAVAFVNHPQLFPPEGWEQIQRAANEAIHSGTPYELDVRMLHADGTSRWVTARGEACHDARGRVTGLRGTVQDITERKQREEALTLFRSLIDRSNDALEIIDTETHRLLDANDKACRDLGFSRDELLSLTVRDIDPAVDEFAPEIERQCAECGSAMFESLHRRKDGSFFPVEVSIKRVTLDRCYCVSVSRDITERKAAQQALRESEERLRLAAEAGRMFAYTWDAATDEITRSGESRQILGIDSATPLTGHQIVARIHPDDRERVLAVLGALTPEAPELSVRYRFCRPDGSTIWLERNSRAYFDDKGTLTRMVGMVADITERKMAEEVLSSVSRKLLEAQELERVRIARDLHDDIGQRLTLLSVMLEQLRRLPSDSASELGKCIDALQRQTSDISADVQALSHELHSSKLQLLGIVPAMRGYCAELSAYQDVDIDFDHHGVPPSVSTKVALCLFRVLQEALRNAVQHSSVRHFAVTLSGVSDAIRLCVRDTGVGFDLESASRGQGLGLTSMRERLKLVGGELSIDSQLTRGTTIVARVPLGNGDEGPSPVEHEQPG